MASCGASPERQRDSPAPPAESEPGRPARKLSLAKRIAFTVLVLFATLALTEGILRLLPSTRLGFEYRDGKFLPPKEFPIDRTRNSLGFHDVEPVLIKYGATRIVLLGDSYVEAYTVPLASAVGRRLEHHLEAASGRPHQVVSCGRSGWGQSKQLAVLRRLGPSLQPHVVITLFVPFNDVSDNLPELRVKARKQLRTLLRARPGWFTIPADEAPGLVIPGSRLNQLISHRLGLTSASREPNHIPLAYYVYSTEPSEIWRKAWAQTEVLILETRAVCQELGAQYALVSASTPHGAWGAEEGLNKLRDVYPAMRDGEWDLDLPNRRLERFCQEHNIPFLSLEQTFRTETRNGRRLHWQYDGHWNAEGNDLAARLMADFRQKRG